MRYSARPRFRKYVKGYDKKSFPKILGKKYGKKLMELELKLE